MSTASRPAARSRRTVVVTGIGVISSIGTGADEYAVALREGRSGARPLTRIDTTGFLRKNAAEVEDFEPARWIRNIPLDYTGRAGHFAVAAARQAVENAGLTDEELAARHVLISIGTTDGESHDLGTLVEQELGDGGPDALDPVLARRLGSGRLSTAVARELRLRDAEAVTLTTACAAGNYSIGYGLDVIRSGEADIALCGGADAVCRKTFATFQRLGAITPDVVRPFDVHRKGILTGEGGGVLVLESLESALARGARIYAEVLGYGLSCDAQHPTAPSRDGVARAMELALADAGVKKDQVDYISAHATGTRANDAAEAGAIVDVYGEHPPRTIGLKSMLGHSMGAASALAAAACALSIHNGFIPPTINHQETDPQCPVDCVPNHAVTADVRIVQNNSSAFGGNNAVLILGSLKERV